MSISAIISPTQPQAVPRTPPRPVTAPEFQEQTLSSASQESNVQQEKVSADGPSTRDRLSNANRSDAPRSRSPDAEERADLQQLMSAGKLVFLLQRTPPGRLGIATQCRRRLCPVGDITDKYRVIADMHSLSGHCSFGKYHITCFEKMAGIGLPALVPRAFKLDTRMYIHDYAHTIIKGPPVLFEWIRKRTRIDVVREVKAWTSGVAIHQVGCECDDCRLFAEFVKLKDVVDNDGADFCKLKKLLQCVEAGERVQHAKQVLKSRETNDKDRREKELIESVKASGELYPSVEC